MRHGCTTSDIICSSALINDANRKIICSLFVAGGKNAKISLDFYGKNWTTEHGSHSNKTRFIYRTPAKSHSLHILNEQSPKQVPQKNLNYIGIFVPILHAPLVPLVMTRGCSTNGQWPSLSRAKTSTPPSPPT